MKYGGCYYDEEEKRKDKKQPQIKLDTESLAENVAIRAIPGRRFWEMAVSCLKRR